MPIRRHKIRVTVCNRLVLINNRHDANTNSKKIYVLGEPARNDWQQAGGRLTPVCAPTQLLDEGMMSWKLDISFVADNWCIFFSLILGACALIRLMWPIAGSSKINALPNTWLPISSDGREKSKCTVLKYCTECSGTSTFLQYLPFLAFYSSTTYFITLVTSYFTPYISPQSQMSTFWNLFF